MRDEINSQKKDEDTFALDRAEDVFVDRLAELLFEQLVSDSRTQSREQR